MHRLDTGVKIGQFGKGWDIHDMSPYENRKPRYVRAWYLMLKARMAEIREKASRQRQKQQQRRGTVAQPPADAIKKLAQQQPKPDIKTAKTTVANKGDAIKDLANALFHDDDLGSNTNSLKSDDSIEEENKDRLANEIDFSDSDSSDGMDRLRKNDEQYRQFQSMNKKLTNQSQKEYFDAIAKNKPDIDRG